MSPCHAFYMLRPYGHLNPEERAVIQRQRGSSLLSIALRLEHSAVTVSREEQRLFHSPTWKYCLSAPLLLYY